MNSGEEFTKELLKEAEDAIGYSFRDRSLLWASLTHKSYSNVNGGENNERLEFLGDAVLELIVSEWLYAAFPQAEEGELTTLRQQYVSKTALANLCKRAGFMRFLRYMGGARNLGSKTVESLPEAILGAVYLDGGLKEARAFVSRFVVAAHTENYKSLLQEHVQKHTKQTPVYALGEKKGKYVCTVSAMGETGEGEGQSKQAAEIAAAEKLYRKLTERS